MTSSESPPPQPTAEADVNSAGPLRRLLRSRAWRAAALTALVLSLLLLPFLADRLLHAGKVLRGVWVGEVALSDLDRGQASDAISQLNGRLRATPVRLRIGTELIEVRPDTVGFRLSVESTVKLALEAGRDAGPFGQLAWWFRRWFSPLQLQAEAALDEEKLANAISKWERTGIQDPPFDGGITVESRTVRPDYPRVGHTVDQRALRHLLLDALLQERRKVVEVPLVRVAPALGRSAVDRTVDRARKVLSGSIRLVSADGAHRIELTPKQLASTLGTRRSQSAPAELELHLDTERLGGVLTRARKQIERDPVNASFAPLSPKQVAVVPGQPAIRLRNGLVAVALLRAAHAPSRIGLLPLDRSEQPQLRANDAVALGVRGLVSSFTTHHPCCRPRVENIHRIADLLDGTLIKPGETFSVNERVGPRTRKNGFVPAPTIEDGEMVDTVGGGISQFATTLFNAVFHGGYDIIERQPHTYYFARYPMGHEATLSYPKPDLIFRNDTQAGLVIKCEYGKTFIRVKLYGDNGGRKVRAKVSRRTNIKEPPVELLPNEELDPDEEKVKEAGALGWTVVVARVITFADGKKREEKRRVVYNPRVRRVEVHPCRIPEGEEGYTGEDCPDPEEDLEETDEPLPEEDIAQTFPAEEAGSPRP